MKKFIASLVLALAFCSAAVAGPSFSSWTVSDDARYMTNIFNQGDDAYGLHVYKSGKIYLSYKPATASGDVGTVVASKEVVVRVNNVNVRYTSSVYSSGFILMYPVTEAGLTHVGNELWGKKTVKFSLDTGEWVEFSAVGVQKAWNYLNSVQAI